MTTSCNSFNPLRLLILERYVNCLLLFENISCSLSVELKNKSLDFNLISFLAGASLLSCATFKSPSFSLRVESFSVLVMKITNYMQTINNFDSFCFQLTCNLVIFFISDPSAPLIEICIC